MVFHFHFCQTCVKRFFWPSCNRIIVLHSFLFFVKSVLILKFCFVLTLHLLMLCIHFLLFIFVIWFIDLISISDTDIFHSFPFLTFNVSLWQRWWRGKYCEANKFRRCFKIHWRRSSTYVHTHVHTYVIRSCILDLNYYSYHENYSSHISIIISISLCI